MGLIHTKYIEARTYQKQITTSSSSKRYFQSQNES